jgi:hypothetical protein
MEDNSTEDSINLNINYNYEENEDRTAHSQLDNISPNEMLDIFMQNTKVSEREEAESENSKIYFTDQFLKQIGEKKDETKKPGLKVNMFNIAKENGEKLKKKRGRQTEESKSTIEGSNQKIHDKFSIDNTLRKIQVHYISCIISTSNDILKAFNYQERFYKLDYNFKKTVNKDYFESLKKKKLIEIICNNISKKYKDKGENLNHKIYEKIKENTVLKNFFDENYITFFRDFYFKGDKIINLKKYGLDKVITLSKYVKIFKDLIRDNKNNVENSEKYIENLNLCVYQNYIPENKFLTN